MKKYLLGSFLGAFAAILLLGVLLGAVGPGVNHNNFTTNVAGTAVVGNWTYSNAVPANANTNTVLFLDNEIAAVRSGTTLWELWGWANNVGLSISWNNAQSVLYTNGSALIAVQDKTVIPLRLFGASGQAVDYLQVLNNSVNVIGGINTNGIPFWGIAGGVQRYLQAGEVFVQKFDKTVTNTTGEVTLLGTGIGSLTLDDPFWAVGRSIHAMLRGSVWTAASPGNTAIFIKVGTANIATNTFPMTGSLVDDIWELDVTMTCRTNSAIGFIECQGTFKTINSAGTSTWRAIRNASAIFDTTSNVGLDVTTTNTVTTTSFTSRNVTFLVFP